MAAELLDARLDEEDDELMGVSETRQDEQDKTKAGGDESVQSERYRPKVVKRRDLKQQRATQRRQGEPVESNGGWVVMCMGLHEEADEDEVRDVFGDCGHVVQMELQRDRRTGKCLGSALVKFEERQAAAKAVTSLHGTEMLGRKIKVDWAFRKPRRVQSRASRRRW